MDSVGFYKTLGLTTNEFNIVYLNLIFLIASEIVPRLKNLPMSYIIGSGFLIDLSPAEKRRILSVISFPFFRKLLSNYLKNTGNTSLIKLSTILDKHREKLLIFYRLFLSWTTKYFKSSEITYYNPKEFYSVDKYTSRRLGNKIKKFVDSYDIGSAYEELNWERKLGGTDQNVWNGNAYKYIITKKHSKLSCFIKSSLYFTILRDMKPPHKTIGKLSLYDGHVHDDSAIKKINDVLSQATIIKPIKCGFEMAIAKCIKSSGQRFIIIPLTILVEVKGVILQHANVILYDKHKRTLERFEPETIGINFTEGYELNDKIEDFFKFLNYNTFIKPALECPNIQGLATRKLKEANMYCLVWSWLYIDIKLTFGDYARNVLNYLLQQDREWLGEFINSVYKKIKYI